MWILIELRLIYGMANTLGLLPEMLVVAIIAAFIVAFRGRRL